LSFGQISFFALCLPSVNDVGFANEIVKLSRDDYFEHKKYY